jgi:signal transduction histidine kinase
MEESAMQQGSTGLRRPPQITLALDHDKCVLYVNRDLAGTGFDNLKDQPGARLHSLIHPDCDTDCRFNQLLNKAWTSLNTRRESVEWEIDDPVLRRHLRLNLSRPPTPSSVTVERRRRFALLTLTDITEIRREYESVLSSNRELQRKLDQLEGASQPAANDAQQAAQSAPFNARVLAAQERERRRIAVDLHDGVAQTMGVVKYSVESRIADLKRRYPDMELADFELVVDQIREAIEDLRKISRNLSPSMLSEFGICTAIDMLCSEFAAEIPNVEVICAACVNEIRLPEAIKVAIYRVVQEALNNIGKHAGAQSIRVALLAEDSGLSLEINDDGKGFELGAIPKKTTGGLGLESMRERVELTGGEFDITSAVGKGTTISAAWPEAALDLLRDEPVLDRENGHG